MKALILGNRSRFEQYDPRTEFYDRVEKIYIPLEAAGEEITGEALEADFIAADAIAPVTGGLIRRMPNLRVVHSEGVAYDKIDLAAAAERGVYVCNNRGVNAGAVAEQAIFLMLGLLRDGLAGDRAVRAGDQIGMKERMMLSGFRELGECQVGLVGLGAIGQATARRLLAFGCRVVYCSGHRRPEAEENALGVQWMSLSELCRTSDIVSLHVPVTDATRGMVDEGFLRAMRPDAYLINTARGDIVENEALCRALGEGWIAGAGLDTIAPEPVAADHPLLTLPADCPGRLLLSPHIGGVSGGVFRRAHINIWAAFQAVAEGREPQNTVHL